MHLILSLTTLAIALADQLLSNLLFLSPAHTRRTAREPQGSPGRLACRPLRARCQGPGLALQVSDTGGCMHVAGQRAAGCCTEPPICRVLALARLRAHVDIASAAIAVAGRGGTSSGRHAQTYNTSPV